jgi:eukaryotic-like serine/threonine-protein kinase
VHQAILHQTPAPARDLNVAVPAKLDAIISKALEKDRADRYQSAADLAADLEAFQGPKHRRRWKWLTVAVLSVVLVAGGSIYWRLGHTFKLSAQDTVVLADLDNRTSDPIFDDALNTALRVAFEQTPFLNLLAPDKVRGTLQLLHRPEDAKLTAERAREVCLRTHSRAVIASSIADAGNHFDLELDGIDCPTGRTIARVKREAGSRNEIVRTLGALGVELRRKMGEPRDSLQKFSEPLEEATSSSLEALQLLSQGYRHHSARDDASTLYYQRAIEADPNLALAYVALGARYSNVGEMELASAAEKKAFERSDRLTGPAHFLVETLYYDLGTGELEKAYPVHEQWVQTFPLDPRAHINFSFLLQLLGQYDRAAAESRESVRLAPSVATYVNLIVTTILANRLDEAKADCDEAEARGMTNSSIHSLRHLVAFLEQDKPAMQEQLAWAMDHREAGEPVFKGESSTQAYYGRFRMGAQWLHQENDAARANPMAGNAVDNADFALQEAEAGSITSAQQIASSLVNGAQDRDTRLELALLYARTGNIERARQIADAINREFPLDTLTQDYSLPAIRAAVQLRQNDPAGAIENLRPALKYDAASPNPFNSLYPAYLRGLAYLQMNNGRLAKPEFQKVLDHPEVVGRFVTGSLARLQLARAQAMDGDPVAARKSYQDFLRLWQDADPNTPILAQAKAEYAKLNLTELHVNDKSR